MSALKAVPPVISYCLASMSMIFTNKFILGRVGYQFPQVTLLLIAQGLVCCLTLKGLDTAGHIQLEPLVLEKLLAWLPVTVSFVMMLYTGSMTLTFLAIAVITVFKNLTNLVIAAGDWYFFGQTVTWGILGSFALMVVGSVATGFTDLEFDLVGYVWMAGNCLSQAVYVLYMRQAKTTTKLSQWGMSYYNNLLSILILLPVAVINGDFQAAVSFPYLTDPLFIAAVVFSGLIGTCLSLSVFWVVGATSPTTYSMIGSINKIPITLLSVLVFRTVLSWESFISICIGLVSGVIYTLAKLRMQSRQDGSKLPK